MSLSADGINYLPPFHSEPVLMDPVRGRRAEARLGARHQRNRPDLGAGERPGHLGHDGSAGDGFEPVPNTAVTVARPLISVMFDEPVVAATWSNLGLVMQAATGGIVPGEYAYYPTTLTGTFTPSADLVPGLVYILTVGDVRDPAGNRVRDSGSWALQAAAPDSRVVTADRTVILYGDGVDLKGTASVPAGDSVVLEVKPGGVADFTTERTFPAGQRRVWDFVRAIGNVTYRASYPSTPTTIGSASKMSDPGPPEGGPAGTGPATTAATAGKPVTLTTQVTPAGVASVSFRLYRFDAARVAIDTPAASVARPTRAAGRR
jgi:hypothetical protein